MSKKIRFVFLIGLMWPLTVLWASTNVESVPTVQAHHDHIESTASTVNIESTEAPLQQQIEEAKTGTMLWGAVLTVLFLLFVFASLIIVNISYRKKALSKIKRELENDHN